MNETIDSTALVVPDPQPKKSEREMRAWDLAQVAMEWENKFRLISNQNGFYFDTDMQWHEPFAVHSHPPCDFVTYFIRSLETYGRIASEIGELLCEERVRLIIVVSLEQLPSTVTELYVLLSGKRKRSLRYPLLFECAANINPRKPYRLFQRVIEEKKEAEEL